MTVGTGVGVGGFDGVAVGVGVGVEEGIGVALGVGVVVGVGFGVIEGVGLGVGVGLRMVGVFPPPIVGPTTIAVIRTAVLFAIFFSGPAPMMRAVVVMEPPSSVVRGRIVISNEPCACGMNL